MSCNWNRMQGMMFAMVHKEAKRASEGSTIIMLPSKLAHQINVTKHMETLKVQSFFN